MGEIVKVRKGGLHKQVHNKDLELFVCRDPQQPATRNAVAATSAVDIARMEWVCDWELGKIEFWL